MKMNTKRYKLLLQFLNFMLLLIVAVACSSSSPKSEPQGSPAAAESQAEQPLPETAEPEVVPTATENPLLDMYLGDAATNYGYALTAISVQDPAVPNKLSPIESGNKIIAVEVIISNLSGDMLNVNPIYATLVDAEGNVYKLEFPGVDYPMATLNLNPGEKVKGRIAFQVPENAVADSIKFNIDGRLSDYLQASLKTAPAGHFAVAEPPSTPGSPLSKLGEVVENFGYSLSAVAVQDPSTLTMLYYPERPGFKLVAVEIVLGNVSGSEALEVNPLFANLIDKDGFVYEGVLGGLEGQINSADLNLGKTATGWIAYLIPETASPASLRYMTRNTEGNYLQTGLTK
jgi:hypothetical protein